VAKKKTGAPARAAKTTKSARAARPARAAKGTKAAKPARRKKGAKKTEAMLIGAPTPMIRIFGAMAIAPPLPPSPPPPPPPALPLAPPFLNVAVGNMVIIQAVFRSGGYDAGAIILNTADTLGGSTDAAGPTPTGNILTAYYTFASAGTFTFHATLTDVFDDVVASDALIVKVN
jgi:hypothetical protein